MNKIFLSFEAETEDELLQLVLRFAMKGHPVHSWMGQPPPPLDPQSIADDKSEMSDEEYDSKHPGLSFPDGNGADPEPAPEPAPKRARAPRTPRVPAAVPAPAPAPAAPPVPAPPTDLPPLDTLKAGVTNAVRLGQKNEGPRKILDLLPGFKDATGLTFVMNAEEKHRQALYDLCVAAGLSII